MPIHTDTFTFAHVTHEAVEHIGGIGTVLTGLMTSKAYQQKARRSIVIGPTSAHLAVEAEGRLGPHGDVVYSSIDNIDRANLGTRLRPVESSFNVHLVYGTRRYQDPNGQGEGEAEILLIDVFSVNPDRLNLFKARLWERFGLDSMRYESLWDFEEYVRLAEPAYYALRALLQEQDLPCIVFSHEFMGMPTALACILDGTPDYRTVFHAHECATARRLVEDHEGHDLMFYNVLDSAREANLYVEDVFGQQSHLFRHALISRSYLCDAIIAVGDRTRDELRFLNEHFDQHPIELVYNGLPVNPTDLESKLCSRKMLQSYARELVGYEPEVLMTHVTRPVISKGIWRDLQVCHHLDEELARQDRRGILFILTTGGGNRRAHDVFEMEREYGWPRHHHEGYPDLVGPEIDLNTMIEIFNREHQAIQVVLVNQFGWGRERVGKRLDPDMNMAELRRATDVEFGIATYEPFGISPLEPLAAGAICVISTVCGCHGFVRQVSEQATPNVICADFVSPVASRSIEDLMAMTQADRDRVESKVSRGIAGELADRLPTTDRAREVLIGSGQELASRMSWDQVVQAGLLPMLERIGEINSPTLTAS